MKTISENGRTMGKNAKRRRFNVRACMLLLFRQIDGKVICPVCDGRITEKNIETIERDHIVPLALGGEDTLQNMAWVHKDCHSAKTKEDVKIISKAKRQGRETGQQARRARRGEGSIPSRPFATNRDGPLKKKMGGSIEKRQAD